MGHWVPWNSNHRHSNMQSVRLVKLQHRGGLTPRLDESMLWLSFEVAIVIWYKRRGAGDSPRPNDEGLAVESQEQCWRMSPKMMGGSDWRIFRCGSCVLKYLSTCMHNTHLGLAMTRSNCSISSSVRLSQHRSWHSSRRGRTSARLDTEDAPSIVACILSYPWPRGRSSGRLGP